ncbi:MAG TPA: hypothetical protein VIS49_10520 [Cyclobacteriaceae bacterium]
MIEEILKAFSLVVLPSTIKFIFGPFAGKAAGLHLLTTMIGTASGMMVSVVAFTYFGEFIRAKILRYFGKKNERLSERERSNFIKKYGLLGISILTPIVLTPIGGTILAVSITPNKKKILLFMLISSLFWSAVITAAVYFGYDAIIKFVKQIQPV